MRKRNYEKKMNHRIFFQNFQKFSPTVEKFIEILKKNRKL